MLDGEKLITLKQAQAYLKDVRGLVRHWEAIRRWAAVGVRGVRLETLDVGGRMHTSAEALERFFEATTRRPLEPAQQPSSVSRLTAKQQQEHEEGLRRLRDMGVRV